MVTFLALYGADPEDLLNDDGSVAESDARDLAYQTHRYVHEHLDNQVEAATVVTDDDLHEELQAVWDDAEDTEAPEYGPETYYAVRNDNPVRSVAENEPVAVPGEADAPERTAMYGRDNKEKAFEQRDKLREQAGNSDLNVYKLTVEPVADPRGDMDEQQ
jgi:hypothetical protein